MAEKDLLGKLGTKSSEGSAKTEPSQSQTGSNSAINANAPTSGENRGTDLLKNAASKSEASANAQANTETKTNSASASKEEPLGSTSSSTSTEGDWTPESLMKEIKKLREENKATRIKYSESVERLKVDSDSRITAKEQELSDLVQAKAELEQIKAKEEDRKRDLSEKLAHREARIAELQTKYEAENKSAAEKIRQYEAEVQRYKAEAEAQVEVYKQRLDNELTSIPEKFKDIASYIVKGAGDPRDALVALNEAKLRGLFDDKTVIVSHSVPGAANGARSTQERLDTAAQEARSKMGSQEKIKEGLKQVRSGTGNSAFRIR